MLGGRGEGRGKGRQDNLHQGSGCQVKILTCAHRQVYYSERCWVYLNIPAPVSLFKHYYEKPQPSKQPEPKNGAPFKAIQYMPATVQECLRHCKSR